MDTFASFNRDQERTPLPPEAQQPELSPQQELRLGMLARATKRILELSGILIDEKNGGSSYDIVVKNETGVPQVVTIPITGQTLEGCKKVRKTLYQGLASTPAGKEAAENVLGWTNTTLEDQEEDVQKRADITSTFTQMWEKGSTDI
jgi:hypothetical protein